MIRILLYPAIFAMALGACVRPLPDRLTATRGKFTREVIDSEGRRCTSSLPFTVAFDGVDSAEVYAADAPWSHALGYPITTPAGPGEMPEMVITTDVRPTDHPDWIGSDERYCDGGVYRHRITLYVAGDAVQDVFILMHEIGHALGVEHSLADASIMHATITPALMSGRVGPDSEAPPAQWVRVRDVNVVRALWTSAIAKHETEIEGLAAPGGDLDDDPGADGIGTSPSDPGDLLPSMLNAAKSGQWRLLAGLLLGVLVWATRKWGARLVPWLGTDRGGAVLVLVLGLLGGVATTLAGDQPLSWSLLVDSLSMAFGAAGGYAVTKKLVAPSDQEPS